MSADCLQRCTYSGNHGYQMDTKWIPNGYHDGCHDLQSENILETNGYRDGCHDLQSENILETNGYRDGCHDLQRGAKLCFSPGAAITAPKVKIFLVIGDDQSKYFFIFLFSPPH